MRHSKSGSREFTHVYVAKCGRFTKIGATTNVASRIMGLRSAKKGSARLVKSWEHARAYEVEGSALWIMRQSHEYHEREWFVAPLKAAVAAVEDAIKMVDEGKPAPFTKRRLRFAKDEARWAECKKAADEFNAWAYANPEEYERILQAMKR